MLTLWLLLVLLGCVLTITDSWRDSWMSLFARDEYHTRGWWLRHIAKWANYYGAFVLFLCSPLKVKPNLDGLILVALCLPAWWLTWHAGLTFWFWLGIKFGGHAGAVWKTGLQKLVDTITERSNAHIWFRP